MDIQQTAIEIYKHKQIVLRHIINVIDELLYRGLKHDNSKLEEPELSGFAALTDAMKNTTYGSPEYHEQLAQLKPIIDHHTQANCHHPECHKDGIQGMTLIDIVEMFCDWFASIERNKDGDIFKSIELNQKRFGYSDDVKAILLNTAGYFS